jgi:hypothetical protein
MIRSDEDAFYRAMHDFYKTNGSDPLTYVEGDSMTRQEFAEECDINTIMKRYEGHGTGPGMLPNNAEPVYFDFADAPKTLMDYMAFMQSSEAAFMSLNANVRREFNNDARLFVYFDSNPDNLDQMRQWGLAPPAKPQDAVPPVAAPQPAPPVAAAPGGVSAAPAAPTHVST